MKNLFRIFTLLSLIIFMGCSEELFNDTIQQDKIAVKNITYADILKNSKLNHSIEKLKNYKAELASCRIVYDSINDFYFDDSNGKLVEINGNETYTFSMIRKYGDDKVENIIFSEKDNGDYEVLFAKYDFTQNQMESMSDTQIKDEDATITSLNAARVPLCLTIKREICGIPVMQGDLGGGGGTYCITVTTYLGCEGSGGGGGIVPTTGSGSSASPTGTNGNPISTGSSVSAGGSVSTTAVQQSAELQFIFSLGLSGDAFYCLPTPTKQVIVNYIVANPTSKSAVRSALLRLLNNIDFTSQSEAAQTSIFNYLVQNGFSAQSRSFVEQLISEISNTPVNNLPANVSLILPNVANRISDMNDYLKCFSSSQPAVFTLYVDQPTAGSNSPWSGNPTSPNVGHTFISILQGGIRRVVGFYPSSAVSLNAPSVSGTCENDSAHPFDVSISVNINPAQLSNLLHYIIASSTGVYNLNTNNCTDFGMASSNIIGMAMPSAFGTWGIPAVGSGSGDNPGQLGQNIRNMPTPVGAVKNTAGGNSLSNIGTCL